MSSGVKRSKSRLVFRILYRSVYFFLYVILLALLLVTPADAIQRSVSNDQFYNILFVGVAYAVSVGIIGFIYVVRLYVNKTALASIPKSWVPIDRGDLKRPVHKMIAEGLKRSALVAYEARPRVVADEDDTGAAAVSADEEVEEEEEAVPKSAWRRSRRKKSKDAAKDGANALNLPPNHAVWGVIEHPGWASPNAPDLPNLQYETVVAEIPHLVEAKALTLAPTDPESAPDAPILDPEAVALLQRPPHTGLRGYAEHLASLGVVVMDDDGSADFLLHYESARFSTRPLLESQFKRLMHLFAEFLEAMRPLDLAMLAAEDDGGGSIAPTESDIDDDAPRGTNPSTPQGTLSRSVTVSSGGSRHLRPGMARSAETWRHYRTAPTTPQRLRPLQQFHPAYKTGLSQQSSVDSFAQSRRPYTASQPSSSSLASRGSDASGSVIRLATADDDEELPYVLSLRETAGS